MNVFSRIWKAIQNVEPNYPHVPNTADMEGDDLEDKPGIECRWIEVSVRCKSPINEGENMPAGCDARCPARVANEQRVAQRERENMRFYQ